VAVAGTCLGCFHFELWFAVVSLGILAKHATVIVAWGRVCWGKDDAAAQGMED
jgi:hypothetical protein